MSDKDYQIEYSNINERSQTPYLMDYVPDQLIKVYPYRAAKGNKNKPFIQTLTASIIRLSQDVEDYAQLRRDEKGIKFIEMFAAWDDQTKVTVTSGAETFQQDIRKLRTYTALFNDFFKTDDDKPDFFTIGEPFNNTKYKAGTQRVYYGSNFQPSAQELIVDLMDQGYNVDEETRLAEITMQDVAVLEEQYSKSVLLFTLDGNLMLNPTVTYNSKREGKQVTKPGIRLKANSYSLINSIKAKGELDFGNFKAPFADIDFYTEHLFAPIKMSPDKVTDKITMYADWFDYTLTMPFFVADIFDSEEGEHLQNIETKVDEKVHAGKLYYLGDTTDINKQYSLTLDGSNGTYIPTDIVLKTDVVLGEEKNDFTSTRNEITLRLSSPKKEIDGSFKFKDSEKVTINHRPWHLTGRVDAGYVTIWITNAVWTVENGVSKITYKLNWENHISQGSNRLFIVNGTDVSYKEIKNFKVLLDEDIMLLEDMILISAGFKDNWKKAPRDHDHQEKIDPNYRVGHKGIRIQNIADKKPADIIDGLVLEHEDTYPSFRTTPERYLMFRSIVNALSKYIVSNTYTTNQGFNELNAITLPWFLMLAPSEKDANKIEYWTNKHKVNINEFGNTSAQESYLLNGVVYNDQNNLFTFSKLKWATYSSYFTKTFSQLNNYTFKKGINLTDMLNLSGTKVVETDRKVILPELKDTIAENDKINVPGQNTGTADYLSNYFYLPLNEKKDIEKIFFNGLKTKEILTPGARILANIPRTRDGEVWTKQQAKDYIYKIYSQKNIEEIKDSDISINAVNKDYKFTGSVKAVSQSTTSTGGIIITLQVNIHSSDNKFAYEFYTSTSSSGGYEGKAEAAFNTYYKKDFYAKFNISPDAVIERSEFRLSNWDISIKHSEFEPVTIVVRQGVEASIPLSTPQLVDRQTYFDKTEWMKFTNSYLMPLGQMIDLYLVSEGDTKIDWLEELTVMSVWGDEIRLSCDGMTEELVFTLPSVSDETIAVQRIVII